MLGIPYQQLYQNVKQFATFFDDFGHILPMSIIQK